MKLRPSSPRYQAREVFPGVTVNPDVRFGSPCMAGTGIDTAVIRGRFVSGESLFEIARDYEISVDQILMALRWECLSPGQRKRRIAKATA